MYGSIVFVICFHFWLLCNVLSSLILLMDIIMNVMLMLVMYGVYQSFMNSIAFVAMPSNNCMKLARFMHLLSWLLWCRMVLALTTAKFMHAQKKPFRCTPNLVLFPFEQDHQ